MFLHLLNIKEQKNFLELDNILIKEYGELRYEELLLMNTYRYEARLSKEYYPIENKGLEYILHEFEKSDEKTKEIILIELVALSISDNDFVTRERNFIDIIRNSFNIDKSIVNSIIVWVEKLNSINKEVVNILEENV